MKTENKGFFYNSPCLKLALIFVFVAVLMMNIVAAENEEKTTFAKLTIQLKAIEVATQISAYLDYHSNKTMAELQEDPFFIALATQVIGNTGYTALIDSESGMFYAHPRESIRNTYTSAFVDTFPSLWKLLDESTGPICTESSGFYDWEELDGSVTKKYLHIACVESKSADGKSSFVVASTYLDEIEAKPYLEQYGIKTFDKSIQEKIKQKAIDVAKQIELYLRAYPEKTLKELQEDNEFKKIAIQSVGETGSVIILDYDLIIRFHEREEAIDIPLENLIKDSPELWNIVLKSKGGYESSGSYKWIDEEGIIRDKYNYQTVVNTKTADGVGLIVAASTFLDEYGVQIPIGDIIKSASEYDYPPFSIVAEDGKADGFSVELLTATLNAVDLDVEFYVGPWSEIKEDLAEGRIQVLPLVDRTPERELVYDFTVPYLTLYGAIFVREGDERIKTIEDLADKEVIVMKGDTADEFVRREKVSEKIITTESFEDAFKLLSEGKYDAVVAQKLMGTQLLEHIGIDNVILIAEINDFKQDFTFAVKDGDAELLIKLNEGLSKIINDGTYQKIYDKWIREIFEEEPESTPIDTSTIDFLPYIISEKIGLKLENIENDLRFLKDLPALNDFVNGDISAKSKITDLFLSFSKNNNIYYQIRYLDESGKEIIRIDNINDESTIISEDKLQNKKGRYYFDDVMQLDKGNIYVSPLDLNIEKGELENRGTKENPIYVPVIRYSTPVFDDNGNQKGIVLLNIYAKSILDILKKEQTKLFDAGVYLVNNKGYFLLHPDTSREFSFMFENDITVLSELGVEFQEIFSNDYGTIQKNDKEFTYRKIFPSKLDIISSTGSPKPYAASLSKIQDRDYFWVLIVESPIKEEKQYEEEPINLITWLIVVIIIIFIILIFLFTLNKLGIIKSEKNTIMVLLGITLLVIMGLFIFNTYQTMKDLENRAIETFNNQQEILADNIAKQIESMITAIIDDSISTATEPGLVSGIEEQEYDVLGRMQERLDRFVDTTYFLNEEGIVRTRMPYKESYRQTYKEYSTKPGVKEALVSHEIEISDLFKSGSGKDMISIVTPINTEQGFAGLLRANILLSKIIETYIVSNDFHNSGPHNHVHLIIDGYIYITTNKSFQAPEKMVNDINQGKDGKYVGICPNPEHAEEVIMVYHTIDMGGKYWGVLIESEKTTILSSVSGLVGRIWTFTTGIILSIIVIGVIFNFLLTKSLRKEVDDTTKEIKDVNVGLEKTVKERTKELEKLNVNLEKEVEKRTKELQLKIDELQTFHKIAVGRELKMIELKKEIKELESKK